MPTGLSFSLYSFHCLKLPTAWIAHKFITTEISKYQSNKVQPHFVIDKKVLHLQNILRLHFLILLSSSQTSPKLNYVFLSPAFCCTERQGVLWHRVTLGIHGHQSPGLGLLLSGGLVAACKESHLSQSHHPRVASILYPLDTEGCLYSCLQAEIPFSLSLLSFIYTQLHRLFS